MTSTNQPEPKIASREEWLRARKALFLKEKEMTHQLDALRLERRNLPWVRIDTPYVFDAPGGTKSLSDLFEGRSQLAVYHFMLSPDSDHICPGCSFLSDHTDAARQHFEHADLSFVAVSRAKLSQIEAVKQRMGWKFNWVSSFANTFSYEFGASFTEDDIANGRAIYNYGTPIKGSQDMHGTSIFAKDAAGVVYHTYSTFARGDENFVGAFSWLDVVPKGRNEQGTMSWVRLHDEYDKRDNTDKDCCS